MRPFLSRGGRQALNQRYKDQATTLQQFVILAAHRLVDEGKMSMEEYSRIVIAPYAKLCRQHGVGLSERDTLAHAAIKRQASATSVKLLKEKFPALDLAKLEQELHR